VLLDASRREPRGMKQRGNGDTGIPLVKGRLCTRLDEMRTLVRTLQVSGRSCTSPRRFAVPIATRDISHLLPMNSCP